MLKPVLNRNSVLACSADCPADNHARPLAQFLYGTLQASQEKHSYLMTEFTELYQKLSNSELLKIISESEKYNPIAVETAKTEIASRQLTEIGRASCRERA